MVPPGRVHLDHWQSDPEVGVVLLADGGDPDDGVAAAEPGVAGHEGADEVLGGQGVGEDGGVAAHDLRAVELAAEVGVVAANNQDRRI